MKRDDSDNPDSFADWVRKEGIVLMPMKKKPSADNQVRAPAPSPSEVLSPDSDGDEAHYAEMTSYTQNGVDVRQLRRLRSRQPENKVDLHGFTVAEAYEELSEFFSHAIAHGLRVVEIVHGRGNRSPAGQRGKLRAKTRQWCGQSPVVLAYNEMPRNPGALIVLLKKRG